MARIDAERRELAATLVVYGAPKVGKTTILHCIQRSGRAGTSRRLRSVRHATPAWLRCSIGCRSNSG